MSTKPAVSRRSLLSGVAASAILPWRPSRAAPSGPYWEDLAKLIDSPVLLPNDPRFVRLTQPENLYYYRPEPPGAPKAVVRPPTSEAIAKSVRWAADQDIPLVARSGGHSYAGCSTIPGGLIINTAALRYVDYDPASNLLRIGGGTLNADIFKALRGLRPAPFKDGMAIVHGRCGAVGVSAYLMGGGVGFDMRSFGVGCDLVDSVDVALADGTVVTASQDNYSDLFWALRGGGGGNLGIATAWWLRPFAVSQAAAFVAIWQAGNDLRALQAPFTTIVRALENSPPELGAQVTLGASRGKPWPTSIRLLGQFRGTWDEFNRRCPGLLKDTSQPPAYVEHVEGAYWDIQEFLDQEPIPNRYRETSLCTGLLSDDAIGMLFTTFGTWPGTTSAARITFFRTGGAMNTPAPHATAFVHRRSEWLADTDIDWDDRDTDKDVEDSLQWQRQVHAALDQAFPGQGSYQNFPDPGLVNHGVAYWGTNLERLRKVKLHYDLKRVFTPPQNQEIPV